MDQEPVMLPGWPTDEEREAQKQEATRGVAVASPRQNPRLSIHMALNSLKYEELEET